jgi:hypothetical protein
VLIYIPPYTNISWAPLEITEGMLYLLTAWYCTVSTVLQAKASRFSSSSRLGYRGRAERKDTITIDQSKTPDATKD